MSVRHSLAIDRMQIGRMRTAQTQIVRNRINQTGPTRIDRTGRITTVRMQILRTRIVQTRSRKRTSPIQSVRRKIVRTPIAQTDRNQTGRSDRKRMRRTIRRIVTVRMGSR